MPAAGYRFADDNPLRFTLAGCLENRHAGVDLAQHGPAPEAEHSDKAGDPHQVVGLKRAVLEQQQAPDQGACIDFHLRCVIAYPRRDGPDVTLAHVHGEQM